MGAVESAAMLLRIDEIVSGTHKPQPKRQAAPQLLRWEARGDAIPFRCSRGESPSSPCPEHVVCDVPRCCVKISGRRPVRGSTSLSHHGISLRIWHGVGSKDSIVTLPTCRRKVGGDL